MNTPFNNVGRGPGSRLPPHLQPPHAQASQLQQLDAATAAAADYGPSRLAPSYQAPTPQPSWEQANAAAVQSFGQPMMPTIGMGGYDPNVVGVPQQQGIMNRSSPPQVAPGNGRYYSHEHTNSNGSVTAAFPPVEMPYIGMGPSMSWGAAMSDNEGSMPGRAGGGGGGRRDDKRPNGHTTQPPDVDSRPGTAGNMLDVAAQSGQLRGLNKTSPEDDDGEDKVDHRKRKRNRTIRSCVPCHNHKRKVSVELLGPVSGWRWREAWLRARRCLLHCCHSPENHNTVADHASVRQKAPMRPMHSTRSHRILCIRGR